MTYLEKRLKEIDDISAFHYGDRKEIFTQQLIEQGFHDGDTFDLWSHLVDLILPRLKRFNELKQNHPYGISSEEWTEIIGKMIIAFELLQDDLYKNDKQNLKIEEGLNFFAKWFRGLWW